MDQKMVSSKKHLINLVRKSNYFDEQFRLAQKIYLRNLNQNFPIFLKFTEEAVIGFEM